MDPSVIMEHIDAIGLIPLLIWQSIRMEKKLDAQAEQMDQQRKENDERNVEMIKGWEKQLKAVIHKFEEREDEIRARYDSVIKTYGDERDRMFRDFDRKLDDVIRFMGRRD